MSTTANPNLGKPGGRTIGERVRADAEFRSLQLGKSLNTPAGKLITEAVSLVMPPTFQVSLGMAVEGLRLAAEPQRKEARGW